MDSSRPVPVPVVPCIDFEIFAATAGKRTQNEASSFFTFLFRIDSTQNSEKIRISMVPKLIFGKVFFKVDNIFLGNTAFKTNLKGVCTDTKVVHIVSAGSLNCEIFLVYTTLIYTLHGQCRVVFDFISR